MDSLIYKTQPTKKSQTNKKSIKMFALKIILILYQISIGYSFQYQNHIPELVKDLILVDQTPSMVITTNSWNLKIISEIQTKYLIPIKFNFLNDRETQKNLKTFLVDLNTENGIQFVRNINKIYFRHPNRWIIINKIDETDEILSELEVLPDSNVIIVDFLGDENFKLQQGKLQITNYNLIQILIPTKKSLQD